MIYNSPVAASSLLKCKNFNFRAEIAYFEERLAFRDGKGCFVDSTRRKAVRRCLVTKLVSGFSRFHVRRGWREVVANDNNNDVEGNEARNPRVSLTLMLISNVKRVLFRPRKFISIQ